MSSYLSLDIFVSTLYFTSFFGIFSQMNKYFPNFTKYQQVNFITRIQSIISTLITLVGSYYYISRQISDMTYYYFLIFLKGYLIHDSVIQFDIDGASDIYGPILIDNRSKISKIIKRVNMMGQEVNENAKGVIIEIYEDGTMIRTIR